jgi:hypothetical protein
VVVEQKKNITEATRCKWCIRHHYLFIFAQPKPKSKKSSANSLVSIINLIKFIECLNIINFDISIPTKLFLCFTLSTPSLLYVYSSYPLSLKLSIDIYIYIYRIGIDIRQTQKVPILDKRKKMCCIHLMMCMYMFISAYI